MPRVQGGAGGGPAVVAKDPALTNNDPSPEAARRAYAFRHVEDMRAIMVKNGDSAKQVSIMEMGCTADPRRHSPYAWHSVTEEQKAEYLVRRCSTGVRTGALDRRR